MGVGPFPLFLLISDLLCRLCECSKTYSVSFSQFLYVGQIRLLIIAFYVTDYSFSSCDISCKLKWKITFWCIFLIWISFMTFHHVSLNAFLHGIHHFLSDLLYRFSMHLCIYRTSFLSNNFQKHFCM